MLVAIAWPTTACSPDRSKRQLRPSDTSVFVPADMRITLPMIDTEVGKGVEALLESDAPIDGVPIDLTVGQYEWLSRGAFVRAT